jgi:D-amino peptidase
VLAHTIGDAVLDVRLAGRSVGEIGLNAALAGHFGVPVVLLSGDDAACAELGEIVPDAVTVEVKTALGQAAAETLHPREAQDRLRRAAADAVRGRDRVRPVATPVPVEVEVDLHAPTALDLAPLVPGFVRAPGARTVTFTGRDLPEAYRGVQLLAQLARVPPS